MKPSLAIPIFDHADTIALVIESLAPLQLPCIVVDDGSGKATQRELKRLAGLHSWVEIERHPRNLGRGAALRTAYRTAARRGATHVVQLDADGQHAAADVLQSINLVDRTATSVDGQVVGRYLLQFPTPYVVQTNPGKASEVFAASLLLENISAACASWRAWLAVARGEAI